MILKKLGFMNIKREDILTRNEMRSVFAGSGNGSCYLTCGRCQNDSCRGRVADCTPQSIWPVCGSHDTGWTCVLMKNEMD